MSVALAQDIAAGYCRCGCGQKTTIANKTWPEKGMVRGKPMGYVRGHNRKRKPKPAPVMQARCYVQHNIARRHALRMQVSDGELHYRRLESRSDYVSDAAAAITALLAGYVVWVVQRAAVVNLVQRAVEIALNETKMEARDE